MKRNKKNFILSDDITIATGSHQGEDLGKVLDRQDAEIDKLKSNVKWIYKYGGVGSGKGGGSDTSSWSIYARLGENFINGETIILPQKGQYKLEVRVNNPSGGTFKLTYTYSNSGTTLSRTATLNIDNSWTLEEMISLDNNSKITIKVLDGNAEIKTVESDYITQSYTFGYDLQEENGKPYVNTVAFLEYIKEVGLKVRVNYSVIEGISSFKIRYKQFDRPEFDEFTVDTTIEKDGIIDLDAFSVPHGSLPDDFIGKFSFKLEIEILGQIDKYEKILNIFPQGLYLLAEPSEGEVYSSISQDLENIHKYYIGTVNFYVTAFYGSQNTGKQMDYTISIKRPDSDSWEEQASGLLTEQVTTRATLRFSTPGWNTIHFVVTFGNNTADRTVYIYVKDFESNLNWYPENLTSSSYDTNKNIFRVGHVDENTSGFFNVSDNSPVLETITMTTNSSEVHLKPKYTNIDAKDCLFCVGIQYNSTSNSDEPILEILSGSGSSYASQTNIRLYQNKVEYGNTPVGDIYIGTELDNYDKEEGKNYHLVSIYRRYVCSSSGALINNDYYELCIYIDGILEAALPNYINAAPIYTDIILHKNNYFINTLELSYFPHGNISENSVPDYLTDTGIVHYWYSYKERVLGQGLEIGEDIINLLNIFEGTGEGSAYTGAGVYLDGSRIAVRSDNVLAGIVRNSRVPVMMISYDEINATQSGDFFTWSEQHYTESDRIPSQRVGVYWSSGNVDGDITEDEVMLREVSHAQTEFSLSIQGSTTKIYSSKNYTLKLNWIGEVHNDSVPLFSPNFNPNNSKTFLPEQSFTLKADVVDSGHSNNTCMGSFINTVTQKYRDSTSSNSGDNPRKYSEFVKNCLEGFPFLLFVRISNPGGNTSEADKYYYLGIYNFNLGRSSYFNLGYSDVSRLPDIEKMHTYSNGFCFCNVDLDIYNLKSTFTCAEIAYNSKYYDFSSYHESILFAQDDNDKNFMFDDIHTGRTVLSTAQADIAGFVRATTRAGGYIFNSIGKTFGSHEDGYSVEGQVPDYRKQYKEVFLNETTYVLDHTDEDADKPTELLNYVEANDEIDEESYTVDYQSLIEYYTVCMAFGLVDSVQKNLTIKTWNGKRFYFTFYDMDTCLGIDNNGDNSTYYAFSDYWIANLAENPTEDENGNTVYPLNGQVTILRDYFDDANVERIKGFDIPSSYAFAVAKYFKTVSGNSNFSSPQSLWARWRNKTTNASGYGFLASADKFIDDFYLGYMKNVNELMFNYNYRQKYLRHKISTTEENGTYYGYDTTDISKFHGRRTEYVRDWLNGRFHIMDAYLNLPQAIASLKPTEAGFQFVEQMPEASEIDTYNKDIFVNSDIFSSGVQSSYGNMSFIIQAPDYSPLVLKFGDGTALRYLLPDADKKYKLDVSNTGGNKVTLGGSALWTYLNSIDSFISSPMTISSTRLKNINGSVGTVSAWNLTLPALQTLKLNSPGYSGTLEFDASISDNYPNLKDIDISFSNINLVVNYESVKTINLRGVGSTANTAPRINISECNQLTDVTLSGTRLSSLSVSPVWTNNLTLTGNNIANIDLRCSESNSATLSISDDGLKVLHLYNFSSVNIVKCPNLETITINGTNLTSLTLNSSSSAPNLESIYIEDASKLKSLSLNGCYNLHELTLSGNPGNITSLNLSGTNVATITYSSNLNPSPSSTYLFGNSTRSMLDLTPMTSLRTLRISENSSVEVIKLRNDPDQPVDVYARGRDKAPYSKLIRIFGHIKITTTYALADLNSEFRIIHGNIWNGGSTTVEDNKTPLRILTGKSSNPPTTLTEEEIQSGKTLDQKIQDHHDNVLFEYGRVISTLKQNITWSHNGLWRWFICNKVNNQIDPVNSLGCTNISFGTSADKYKYVNGVKTELPENERSIGSVLTGICSDTPVSQFDIYYILNAFAISAARCTGENKVSAQNLDLSFWYSGGNRFPYSSPPDRYMFYGCSKITSLSSTSIATTATATRLYSPSHDSQGNIICDNGLYSPLTGLKSITNFMSLGTVYISKYLFRRKTGNYNIESFTGFTTSVICDKVDTYSKSDIDNNVDKSEFGDLTGFFDNIGNKPISITSSFSPNYLNFNTLVIPSKNSVTGVINSFNPTSGYGTIDIREIFKTKTSLSKITNSFKIAEASTVYQNAINSANSITDYNTEGKVLFPITEGMFEGFTNLQYIGANDVSETTNNDTEGTTIIIQGESVKGNVSTITGFRGPGLLKYINQASFPYLIFRPLGANLKTCPGFFAELTTYGNSFGVQEGDEFEFPKNLFKDDSLTDNKSNVNLTDIAAFLKNCKIPYRLTGDGFSVCTKLQNITEIFYGNLGNGDVCSRLKGSIPPRLFYHGIQSNGTSKIYYGTNEELDLSNPEPELENYLDNEHKVVIPGKPNYNRKIRYAYAAFRGCAGIEPYEFKISDTFGRKNKALGIQEKENINNIQPDYINSNYTYWKYITTNGTTWKRGDTRPLDISLVYDGNSGKVREEVPEGTEPEDNIDENIRNLVVCKEDFNTVEVVGRDDTDITLFNDHSNIKTTVGNPVNFFCPPDLFSYFENSASTNIQYMFSHCGLPPSMNPDSFTKAMTGRICPYLLHPITLIRSLAGIFKYCSGLSSVKYLGPEDDAATANTYLIPPGFFEKSTNITVLAGTFAGLYFEKNPSLTNIFYPLRNSSLDIRGIFAWCGYVNSPTPSIKNIFSTNKLTYVSGAFSAWPLSIGDSYSVGRLSESDVYNTTFGWRRAATGSFQNNFPQSIKNKRAQTYYVYYGYEYNSNNPFDYIENTLDHYNYGG